MTNNEAKMAEEICNLRAALRDASDRLEQVLESGLPGKGRSQDEKDSFEGWWIAALDELLPHWIPVGERLPEDKEQCLVARGEDVAVAWWHSRPQEFIHEDIDNAWTPTHWMPLPEPPA